MTHLLQGAALALSLLVPGIAAAADAPAVGSEAPAFRLQDQAGKWHSLSDYQGKWVVLYFYPKDNTPGCTTQACEFRDNIFAYREMGAVILGVPLILAAYAALWRRQRPVFWLAFALILVGLGYLMASGATDDIARSIVPQGVLQPAG